MEPIQSMPGTPNDRDLDRPLWLFQNLTPEETEALAGRVLLRHYRAGEALFLKGDPALQMFVIESGLVKLIRTAEDGTETLVDIRKRGDLIVLNFLSDEAINPLTAVCLEDSAVFGITKGCLTKLLTSNPAVGVQMIGNMGERICRFTGRFERSSLPYVEERLLGVLTDLAREHGRTTGRGFLLELCLTQEELADLVGTHRVSVSRALKTLRQRGKVIQEGKKLIIPIR